MAAVHHLLSRSRGLTSASGLDSSGMSQPNLCRLDDDEVDSEFGVRNVNEPSGAENYLALSPSGQDTRQTQLALNGKLLPVQNHFLNRHIHLLF